MKYSLDLHSQGTLWKGIMEAQVLSGGPWTQQHAKQIDDVEKKRWLLKKKMIHGKNFSRNFHTSVQIIPAISLKSVSTEMLIICLFFFSWGILNFNLLEILMATLLSIIISLFYLVLSKLYLSSAEIRSH